MNRSVLRSLAFVLLAGLLAAPGAGSPSDPSLVVPLDLTAARPDLRPSGSGQRVIAEIPGFGLTSRAGEPMLPLRVLLVAIPEGSVPELQVLWAPSETIDGVDLAPVPRLRVKDRLREREPGMTEPVFEPDARIFGRTAEFPASPLRLGGIGYLREQRYVEVLFTPLLYNPGRRQGRFFPEIRAQVALTWPGGRVPSSAAQPFRPDPFFEKTYQKSLVNYEQGKLFRVPRGESRGSAPASTSAATAAPASAGSAVTATSIAGSTITPAASGAPRYKLQVSRQGIYRLDYTYLSANAPDLLTLDPRTLMITVEGVEIPISIRNASGGSGEADGTFDPGDFLEFFGRPKTGPPTVLNYDFGSTFPDIYEANDFTDTQVYWLTSAGAAGSHLRMPSASGAPINSGFAVATDFADTAVWDENNEYVPLGSVDPWFSAPSLLANSTQATRDLTLAVPGIAGVASSATVTVRLQGVTDVAADPDHRTVSWLNGDTAHGTDFTWDGVMIVEQPFSVPQSTLTDPTTIHMSAPGIPGVTVDRQYLDTVKIQYRRTFTALGDVLAFTYPNQDTRFQVAGFSGAGGPIYDISRTIAGSNEADVVLITGATASGAPVTYTFDVPHDASPTAPATRAFAIAGPGGILQPDGIARAADPVLTNPQNSADFLVVAARSTIDPSAGGSLDNLLAHRLAAQGLTSKIVYIDQIYDEFSFGLRDPNAIRAFLAYAFANWKGLSGTAPPPSFVLLVGDATFDYKNTLQRTDWVDQVPTPIMFEVNSFLGYYSSDNWIASFRGGDQVPDIFLGRISTRDPVSSAAVFDKILRYEESPPPGLWKGRGILVAGDGKDAGDVASFETVQNNVAATYFSAAPYSSPSPPLYFNEAPWNATDTAGFKSALVSQIDSGAAVLSYMGHGAFDIWGLTTFFTAQDAMSLTNGSMLPFMVNVNCLSGGFHFILPSGSLGEGMTNNPSGGAIATFAPSGLSSFFLGQIVSDGLLGPLLGPERQTVLGPASLDLRAALWSQGSIIDLQSYTFLGDPATIFATPAPPPPSGLTATAGNAQVTLSWTPPATTVAGTRIYRAASAPTGPYAPIACTPVTATSCLDATAANATTYYYYAASVDADGFAGRASNFNTDCGTGGPDCVSARPLNPGAPAAPTGLAAADPGTGGRLNVTWSANSETDLKNYTLYYGTLPGQYSASVTAGPGVTALTLNGLSDSVLYYMALSATNTSGHESAKSGPVSAVPHLIQGIAPPRAISDLMVRQSGNDLVLTWSRPVVDIYGRPTTVVKYTIYRGTVSTFMPFTTTPLATIGDGAVTSFTDAGAAAAPSNYYYLVTATDAAGLVSGAGRDLPNGVGDLGLTVPASGTVRLTWSAVTTDMQGLPTIIDHYQVYMSSTPLARGSLGPSNLAMDNVRTLTVDLTASTSPLYFSVIAVDDKGNLSPF